MKGESVQALRICAFCPNPCRRAIPAALPAQLESQTPSALALLALYVTEGTLPWSEDIGRSLGALDAAEACRPACAYAYDIPALVRQVAQEAVQARGAEE
jgi:fumarate reductase (CoM/CoB) subunit B